MDNFYENLVFEGGGVKGIAYVGAMTALEERGVSKGIKRVAGTSAGAINAALVALGFTIPEQNKILATLDFKKFEDATFPMPPMDVTKGKFFDGWKRTITSLFVLARLYFLKGLYPGKYFEDWIGDLIEEKLGKRDATFSDLKAKGRPDLYTIGSSVSRNSIKIFSVETTPDFPISKAIRISMSIPLFFEPVQVVVDGVSQTFVDGGLFRNYPIRLFDHPKYIREDARGIRELSPVQVTARQPIPEVFNKATIGFRLESRDEINQFLDGQAPSIQITTGPLDYIKALFAALMSAQENQHLESNDWERTVYIDTLGVGTVDFALSDETKNALIASGNSGVKDFFER